MLRPMGFLELGLYLVLFTVAADLIARGGDKVEHLFGHGFTGGIIIGVTTALPEMIVIIAALLTGNFDVALGAVTGVNVFLFTLGVGVTGLYYFLRYKTGINIGPTYDVEHKFLIASTIILIPPIVLGYINFYLALPFIFLYVYYLYIRFKEAKDEMGKREVNRKDVLLGSIFLTIGTIILLMISEPFVHEISIVARQIGVPEMWLALILTPLGAEIKELITAVRLIDISGEKGASIAIISFVGSKLVGGTLMFGLIGLFGQVSLSSATTEMIATVIANVIAILVMLDRKLKLLESVGVMAAYFLLMYATYSF